MWKTRALPTEKGLSIDLNLDNRASYDINYMMMTIIRKAPRGKIRCNCGHNLARNRNCAHNYACNLTCNENCTCNFHSGQITPTIAPVIFIAGQIAGAIFIAGQIAPAISPGITPTSAPGGFRTIMDTPYGNNVVYTIGLRHMQTVAVHRG